MLCLIQWLIIILKNYNARSICEVLLSRTCSIHLFSNSYEVVVTRCFSDPVQKIYQGYNIPYGITEEQSFNKETIFPCSSTVV